MDYSLFIKIENVDDASESQTNLSMNQTLLQNDRAKSFLYKNQSSFNMSAFMGNQTMAI